MTKKGLENWAKSKARNGSMAHSRGDTGTKHTTRHKHHALQALQASAISEPIKEKIQHCPNTAPATAEIPRPNTRAPKGRRVHVRVEEQGNVQGEQANTLEEVESADPGTR